MGWVGSGLMAEREKLEEATGQRRESLGTRLMGWFLDRVERWGNLLPEPLTLFLIFAALVPVASWVAASSGWTLSHPATGEEIRAVNLLSQDQIQRMFTEAIDNFTGFAPLGVVLVAMMGIGVAERTGLISVVLKIMVVSVPRGLITAAVVFAGIMSSMAADAGYVVLTPLAAVLFAGLGRHPIAGLCAAFAGVSAGFSANLLPTALDPLLAGFTQSAAQLYDPDYEVHATVNYYFMVVSVFLLTPIGWWVTEKIVEPRLGEWDQSQAAGPVDEAATELKREEKRGSWLALGIFLITLALVAVMVLPAESSFGIGLLRDDEGELGPFYHSIVLLIAIAFLLPGLAYGLYTRHIRSDRDVAKMTGDTMATMGSYIVLAFVIAQFVSYFQWSNLGLMFALSGAELLKAIGLGDVPLLIGIILVTAVVNLFIGSASAKWGMMAPVLVPMMMSLGYSPELTQVAYRIGDSIVNIITPLMPYFAIIIAFAQKYDRRIGLGTLISSMLPYSIAFGVGWTVMMVIWYWLGLPLGPDAPMFYGME